MLTILIPTALRNCIPHHKVTLMSLFSPLELYRIFISKQMLNSNEYFAVILEMIGQMYIIVKI